MKNSINADAIELWTQKMKEGTSHSAYDATLTESDGDKSDGFLYPNFM